MGKNYQNKEDIEQLFEQFLDGEQAWQAAEELHSGDQILARYPAPAPDNKILAEVKLKTGGALLRKRANKQKQIGYKAVVAAAAVIIIGALTITLVEKAAVESEIVMYNSKIASVAWDSDNVADDDAELAVLTAEIEEIEGQVLALRLGENGGNGYTEVAELEAELIEINSDFWKG